jgi:hypothetical protein
MCGGAHEPSPRGSQGCRRGPHQQQPACRHAIPVVISSRFWCLRRIFRHVLILVDTGYLQAVVAVTAGHDQTVAALLIAAFFNDRRIGASPSIICFSGARISRQQAGSQSPIPSRSRSSSATAALSFQWPAGGRATPRMRLDQASAVTAATCLRRRNSAKSRAITSAA